MLAFGLARAVMTRLQILVGILGPGFGPAQRIQEVLRDRSGSGFVALLRGSEDARCLVLSTGHARLIHLTLLMFCCDAVALTVALTVLCHVRYHLSTGLHATTPVTTMPQITTHVHHHP
jgi:hypothetical protein